MNLNIDEQVVQEVIDKQATESITQAFKGYSLRSTLEKVIADSVIPTLIGDAIVEAAKLVDVTKLQQHLAGEIARAVTKGVQAVITETMVSIILDLKKVPSYDDKKRAAAREEILHNVFSKRGERNE